MNWEINKITVFTFQKLITKGVVVFLSFLSLSFFAYFLLIKWFSITPFTASSIVLIGVLPICFFLEKIFVYDKSNLPNRRDWLEDSGYFIIIQGVLPKLLMFGFIYGVMTNGTFDSIAIWPHSLPIGIQLIIMLVVGEFFQYWWHRLSHTFSFLWFFHVVHHRPTKIYFLNTVRFHPVDKFVEFCVDVLLFIALGAQMEVISLYYIIYGINGYLQHSNLNLKFGFLNYIFSTNQLHRWHHHISSKMAFCNFGNNLIIWDMVFGTFHCSNELYDGPLGVEENNVSN